LRCKNIGVHALKTPLKDYLTTNNTGDDFTMILFWEETRPSLAKFIRASLHTRVVIN